MEKIFSLFAAVLFAGSMMAGEYSLTNANIVAAGNIADGYQEWTIKDGANRSWKANAIKNQHSKATSSQHFLQIKKYASNTAYYIQIPDLGENENIQTIKMTVSSTTKPMDGGSNTATLFFSASNSTSAGGAGVASGTGASSVTIDASALGLKGGYITAGGAVRIWDVVVTTAAAPAVATPVIEGEAEFFESTSVTLSCTTEGAKVYYTLDGTEPTAASTEYLGLAIKLSETATVKAIAIKGEEKSNIATQKFTKAPAYASIEELVAAGLATDTKITVSFSEVAITNIFVNNSKKRQGLFLNVKAAGKDVEIYYNSDEVPAAWNIGGVVSGTIQGTWTLYNGQWEIIPVSSTWKWTELTYNVPAVIAIIIPTTSYNAPAAGVSGTINVTYNNIDDLSSAAVAFYEEDGTTPATYEWLATSFDDEKNVKYTVAASEEAEARVAYLKVYVGEVYSELVTIRQVKFVPAYATLPFEFDGGKADIEDTPGLTHSGLGSDYTSASSPKLKFDDTGDYLILQIKENAGELSYDIKGNSFSGSTFKVQTSADGENYTDVKVYTELDAVANEKLDIKSGVRYIKWIYTEKSAGNVALGNISLGKAVDPTGIENTAVEAKALKTIENGQLVIIKNGVKYNVTGAIIK